MRCLSVLGMTSSGPWWPGTLVSSSAACEPGSIAAPGRSLAVPTPVRRRAWGLGLLVAPASPGPVTPASQGRRGAPQDSVLGGGRGGRGSRGRHDPRRHPFSAALRVDVEPPPQQTAREGSSSECSSSSPSPMGLQARDESSDSAEESDRRKDARPAWERCAAPAQARAPC